MESKDEDLLSGKSQQASSDDEEFTGPFRPDMAKVKAKLRNLPTLEKLLAEKDPNEYTEEQMSIATIYIEEIIRAKPESEQQIEQILRKLMKRHRMAAKKSLLLTAYRKKLEEEGDKGDTASSLVLRRYFVSKSPRSQSGVLVVTLFTSPYPEGQRFSCQWNCYYCPNEPGQPRSYLLNEPGVRRANRLEFDPVRQFRDRVNSLVAIGHPADKIELLVLGGTWESYPLSYRESFVRDIFYAANTFDMTGMENREDVESAPRRRPLDLLQEQLLNETANCKIIGLTLETRPDTVNEEMLQQLRRFGCTRVQLGIQHTDDAVLVAVNRQSTREDATRAIKLLKDNCFKVDIHLMPDLPGSTPENDKKMFDDVLNSPDLQADQWKIYPCQVTPFSVIEEWFKRGTYQPYGLDNLIDVLLYAKRRVQPWVRLNRVIRDIPHDYILGGVEVANLRQLLAVRMQQEGSRCLCIRCREVKGDRSAAAKLREAQLVERRYSASDGEEIFISYEMPDDQTLFGFLRLRLHIRAWDTPFHELRGSALIRELHVYGHLIPTRDDAADKATGDKAQHRGIGSMLLERAESIARREGYDRVAVISGVGVRNYYRNRGYVMQNPAGGAFLIKQLQEENPKALGEREALSTNGANGDALQRGGDESIGGAENGSVGGGWRGYVRNIWRRLKRSRAEES